MSVDLANLEVRTSVVDPEDALTIVLVVKAK